MPPFVTPQVTVLQLWTKEGRQQCLRAVYLDECMAWDKHCQLVLVTTARRARARLFTESCRQLPNNCLTPLGIERKVTVVYERLSRWLQLV